MKAVIRVCAIVACLPFAALQAQQSSPSPEKAASKAPTDIYRVFIGKAAPGKAKEMADFLKEPDPDHPKSKSILLQHQDGDSWDFVAIEHLGTKATVDLSGTPLTPQQRTLMDWHTDTYVAGPAWAEFAKQLGLDDASKTADAVYMVGDYRAVPGKRDELLKFLSQLPPSGDTSSGAVLLAHVDGAAWNFLNIVRYDSWEKFAENEQNSAAQTKKNSGGWFELRNLVAEHHDTLTNRLQP